MRSVTEISDAYVEAIADADPVRASRLMGLGRDSAALTDYSPEGHSHRAAVLRSTVADLEVATPADEAERLGAAYLRGTCDAQLELLDRGETQRVVSALSGPPAMIRMTFDVMATDTDDDWSLIAARLGNVATALDGYRQALRVAADRGEVPAARLVDVVAEQCATWAESWFTAFADRYGDGPVRAELDRQAAGAAEAYDALGRWLRDELRPRATEVDGVGADRYRSWARYVLGADLDLDEAYAWGEAELARLQQEQADERERIRPGATVAEIHEHLERHDVVEGVDAYRDALQERLDEAVDGLAGVEFDIPAELRTCVVGIPPEGTALAPYYSPPNEDLTQPGTTWFPTAGRTAFPMWSQDTIVYHEAVPGHHLQLGGTRLLPLTRAQRLGGNMAHLEGWALYAERLMDELGWFRTPETRLGFLSMQAFRAARVVIDIGLHTGRDGWTFERAVDLVEAATGLDRAFATSEVLRYLSMPAQAPCYKLGERVWLAGRQAAMDAHARRGGPDPFDRKAWHAAALALGPLGLDQLATELRRLAGEERSAPPR